MKLKNQVCSLDNAKHFASIGIVQDESLYMWATRQVQKLGQPIGEYETSFLIESSEMRRNEYKDCSFYSAFTVAELGVALLCYAETENEIRDFPDEFFEKWGGENNAWKFVYNPDFMSATIMYAISDNQLTTQEINKALCSMQ